MQLAGEFHNKDNKGKKFHYKRLLWDEQVKEHYRILKCKEGNARKSGVECIEICTPNGSQVSYSKTVIENEILHVNKDKLQQADETILQTERYQQLFGEQGNFQAWEKILRHQIVVLEDANEELKMWFMFMTNFEEVENKCHWTTEEYINSWQGMDEKKTTIQGLQVAHIKCLDVSTMVAEIVSKMALVPLLSGYAPKHWRIGVDSMIPKKQACQIMLWSKPVNSGVYYYVELWFTCFGGQE